MKKAVILLVLLLIPFIVNAEECDITKISITSMEQSGIEGNTEELSNPTFEGRNVGFNLKMYEVGDSITYDMTIKNESEEDYMIDEDTFKTDSEYIEYSLTTDDGTNVVKANSTKGLVLAVTYKSEIDSSDFTDNKYDASNSLTLTLNTGEKAKDMNTISTDNIKNPNTNVNNVIIVIIILFLVTIAILLLDKHITKKMISIILLSLLTIIPGIYAICKAEVEIDSHIEIEKKYSINDTIIKLSSEDNSCIVKYEGNVTDEVGVTVPATRVYYNKCANQRSVIFGGFCWQVIRTTETGGTKVLFDGEPVDGKCESTREDHLGIIESSGGNMTLNSSYLYGSTFSYDTDNNKFILVDTTTATWSDSTYEDLIGKFTCINDTGECSIIYYVTDYVSNTKGYTSAYKIANTKSVLIGTSLYNGNKLYSIAGAGYMYNKSYDFSSKSPGTTEYKYGNSFIYDETTNTYTLSGTTKNISDWSTGYNTIKNTHYTCWNTTGVCSTISFIFSTTSEKARYFDLINGQNSYDLLEEFLSSDNVNRYNSNVKGIVDAWYRHNLTEYTDRIEDAIYCNSRNIINYGGWNPNTGETDVFTINLKFKNQRPTGDLSCVNETDQFSVSNPKAKLTYPIALYMLEDKKNIDSNALMKSNAEWWEISPTTYNINSNMSYVPPEGSNGVTIVNAKRGIRPVISIKGDNIISSGSGSESDPWIIK